MGRQRSACRRWGEGGLPDDEWKIVVYGGRFGGRRGLGGCGGLGGCLSLRARLHYSTCVRWATRSGGRGSLGGRFGGRSRARGGQGAASRAGGRSGRDGATQQAFESHKYDG